mmetsp:Transcript_20842/g.46529  ORF Transcript_20842/g.46529 Transcript_20842/m.46529 type:complete len:220 (-) Transcript_20842:118-777(-)
MRRQPTPVQLDQFSQQLPPKELDYGPAGPPRPLPLTQPAHARRAREWLRSQPPAEQFHWQAGSYPEVQQPGTAERAAPPGCWGRPACPWTPSALSPTTAPRPPRSDLQANRPAKLPSKLLARLRASVAHPGRSTAGLRPRPACLADPGCWRLSGRLPPCSCRFVGAAPPPPISFPGPWPACDAHPRTTRLGGGRWPGARRLGDCPLGTWRRRSWTSRPL